MDENQSDVAAAVGGELAAEAGSLAVESTALHDTPVLEGVDIHSEKFLDEVDRIVIQAYESLDDADDEVARNNLCEGAVAELRKTYDTEHAVEYLKSALTDLFFVVDHVCRP